MDVALLPEIAQTATDGYLRGLRDGGWTGSADAVRTTIAACGAAKYAWFAPAVAGRAARDSIGRSSYGQDASAAAACRRVTSLVTLIADWADASAGERSLLVTPPRVPAAESHGRNFPHTFTGACRVPKFGLSL